jgi:hypothetical protein
MFEDNKYKTEQIPHISSQISDSKHADILWFFTQHSFIPTTMNFISYLVNLIYEGNKS